MSKGFPVEEFFKIDFNTKKVKLIKMKTSAIIIAHPGSDDKFEALKAFMKALKIKFEITKDNPYDPKFVAKIEKSREDYKNGKGRKITLDELNSLWK
jgi:hypothetical protein